MLRSRITASSDEELACLAQQGCKASFELLVRRFQTPVLHFLRHRGAGDEAEDLLQETFVRAYTNLHRYQPRWRFATWLFTIARRISINAHHRPRPINDSETLALAIASHPDPGQIAADREDRQRLWDMAAEILSEAEMTALWLYYVEDMSVREVAVVVERSWVAAKTMLFRARRKLLPLMSLLDSEDTVESRRTLSEPVQYRRDAEVDHV